MFSMCMFWLVMYVFKQNMPIKTLESIKKMEKKTKGKHTNKKCRYIWLIDRPINQIHAHCSWIVAVR